MRTVPTIDTRPTALLMIECFDDRAAYEISLRAIEMIGQGNSEGALEWWRVLASLVELHSLEPDSPGALN